VPPLAAGATAAAVAAAVAKNGIVPEEVQAFSPAKKGTVFKTSPPAGTKLKAGEKLTLFVSAGFPQLLFDNGSNIVLVDGFNGNKLPAPVQGPSTNTDPTWSPDASHIIYASGGRLFLKDLTKPKSPATALTPASQDLEDPSWAPTGNANVIAMDQVKQNGNERDLCLGALAGTGMTVKCKSEPGTKIGRSIHWAPNGKSLLAFGQSTDGSKQGIVQWRTQKPFSPNPDDWSAGRFVTDTKTVGKAVIDAAISPDGKTLALAANFGADFFRLYLTKPGDFTLSAARATPQRACKIAWRGDSKEIVVQESGGGCNGDAASTGQLTGVSLPGLSSKPLNASGDNPAFQPLTLGG
jgi:Tol biopolymer transport system component